MKRIGKIAVCLAGGLAFNAGLRADDLAVAANPSSDNPYATIAIRNIFGLLPPPKPEDPSLAAARDLPKITPTGIQSFFGSPQVLFKVGAKPGTSAKDQYYTLSEGQRQDDIEVIKIDETKSLVTFDNHGTTQELPLASAPGSGGPSGAPSPAGMNPGAPPRFPSPPGNNGAGGIIRFGGEQGGRNVGANGASGFNSGANPNSGQGANNSLQSRIYQPEISNLTPEAVQIMLAGNHLKAQQDNDPTAPLYPPSAIDKQAGITPDGN